MKLKIIAGIIKENPDEIVNNTLSAEQKRSIFEKQIPYIHDKNPYPNTPEYASIVKVDDTMLYTDFLPDQDCSSEECFPYRGESIIWFNDEKDLDDLLYGQLNDMMYETHKDIPGHMWQSNIYVDYDVQARLSDNPDKLYENVSQLPDGHGSGILIVTSGGVYYSDKYDY